MKIKLAIAHFLLLIINNAFGQCNELEIANLKKIAIVFGEKSYRHVTPLRNPLNDAQDISDSLKKVGFLVFTYNDTDIKTMSNAISEWYTKIDKFDVVLFYYSGHGVEVNGTNYLLPIDANPQGISDMYYQAYSANSILANMEAANPKINIMILDACRSNPFRSLTRDIKSGLAFMTGKGAFIGYAASPEKTAQDGEGRNGTYTEGILKYITTPNLTIDQIFTKVNFYVRKKTLDQQIPFKNSSLDFDYCFSIKNRTSSISARSTYIQPPSGILLASNEEKIYTSDSLNDGVSIKDSRTLNNLSSYKIKSLHPYKITNKNSKSIYIIDTLNQSLNVLNTESGLNKFSLALKDKPLSIVISDDERKVYLTNQPHSSNGNIAVIDLIQGKYYKQISTNNSFRGIAISTSGKYLYAISECNVGKGNLYVVDTKTDKIIKTVEGVACGETIGLLPNNKNIYVSSVGEGNISQITVLDANTYKIIKNIDFDSKSVAFTHDSKYVFALGTLEVAVIRTDDNVIVNKLPFATSPKGVTISDDGRVYIWLPREQRTAVFSVAESIQNETPVDPETKLKNFKEEFNKKLSTDNQYKSTVNIERVYQSYINTMSTLSGQLGQLYDFASGASEERNYKDGIFKIEFGFKFKGDDTKKILPKTIAKFTDNFLIISMTEKGKEEIYKVSNNNIDWAKVEQFMRSFFLNRIDQLR